MAAHDYSQPDATEGEQVSDAGCMDVLRPWRKACPLCLAGASSNG